MKLLFSLILLIFVVVVVVKSDFAVQTKYYENKNCEGKVIKSEIFSECNFMSKVQIEDGKTVSYGSPNGTIVKDCQGYTSLISEGVQLDKCIGGSITTKIEFKSYLDAIQSTPMNTCNEIYFLGDCKEDFAIFSFEKDSCVPAVNIEGPAWMKTTCTSDSILTYVCNDDKCNSGNCYPMYSPYKKGADQCAPGLGYNNTVVDNVFRKFIAKIPNTPSSTEHQVETLKPSESNEILTDYSDPNNSIQLIYSIFLLISCLLLSILF